MNRFENQTAVITGGGTGIGLAVAEKLARIERSRLAQECAKLDRKFEQEMAEEGFVTEMDEWPEY